MAIGYSAAIQTARLQAVANAIQGGEIVLETAANAELAAWTISGTLTASGNTLTISNIETNNAVNAIAAGTADHITIKDTTKTTTHISNITVSISGGGGDVQFDSVDVSLNQEITLASIVLTHV